MELLLGRLHLEFKKVNNWTLYFMSYNLLALSVYKSNIRAHSLKHETAKKKKTIHLKKEAKTFFLYKTNRSQDITKVHSRPMIDLHITITNPYI